MYETDGYLESAHRAAEPLLLELEQHGYREEIPIIARSTGRLLSVLVHCMQAHRILELGTAFGYSTLWMSLPSTSTGVPCVPMTRSPITRATTL